MDVRFSAEQEALRDSAVQVVDRLAPRSVRDLDDAERIAKLDAAVDASGWRALRDAGDGRAPLASAVEVAIVAEELGRGLADVSFLGPTLAAELRRRSGVQPATSPGTVAFVADLSVPARADGGVAGTGTVAVDARDATTALVLMAAAGGQSVGETSALSASVGVDLTRPSAAVDPVAEVLPLPGPSNVLTGPDLDAWTALGLALTCADLVGAMRGAVDLACEYARSRRQYGAHIGSFQAVQHMLADAFVALEGSRSVALHAAWAVDALAPGDALAAAAVAKAYCARAARSVCETGVQVHGGIGNTWDCLAHVYLRRAVLSSDVLGGVGPSLARVVEHNVVGHSIVGHSGMGDGRGLR